MLDIFFVKFSINILSVFRMKKSISLKFQTWNIKYGFIYLLKSHYIYFYREFTKFTQLKIIFQWKYICLCSNVSINWCSNCFVRAEFIVLNQLFVIKCEILCERLCKPNRIKPNQTRPNQSQNSNCGSKVSNVHTFMQFVVRICLCGEYVSNQLLNFMCEELMILSLYFVNCTKCVNWICPRWKTEAEYRSLICIENALLNFIRFN